MTNDPERLDVDALAGRWLDEGTPPAEMDEAGRRRLAELQLLHGLLLHLYDRDADARERRVQRVLLALQEPAAVLPHPALHGDVSRPRGRRRMRRMVSWLASAAAMLLIGLIAWKLAAPNPAYAVLQRALEAAGRDGDRTYRVVDRWSETAVPRESTLWVRGDRFVFQPERSLIPGLLLGGDGRQGWAVPGAGPVRVSNDPLEFFRIMTRGLLPEHRDEANVSDREMFPLLQQRTLLRNLGRSYRLELLPSAALADEDAVPYSHLRARRQGETPDSAEVVELWLHPQSSVIVRLHLQVKRESGERRVTLDLIGEEPMPRDWYEHAAHHEAGRPMKDWHPSELPSGPIPPLEENDNP